MAKETCPVDHKSRQAWLDESRSASEMGTDTTSPGLGTRRQTSSIPRLLDANTSPSTESTHANAIDAKSENWIYPSEQMFFDAMRRKNFDPRHGDMKSIVPIHNAVNERAWAEILRWERGKYDGTAPSCSGPKLVSFSGLATAMTPRARINTLLGYAAPFDRHDWVVDRCGTRIDYVIDFYAGKKDAAGSPLNFYLDVRPKLNTWEGCKTRALAWFGY